MKFDLPLKNEGAKPIIKYAVIILEMILKLFCVFYVLNCITLKIVGVNVSCGNGTGARQYFSDTLVFDFPSTIEWQNSFNRIA